MAAMSDHREAVRGLIRARNRYLGTMAVFLPSLAAACSKDPPPVTPEASASSGGSETATTTATSTGAAGTASQASQGASAASSDPPRADAAAAAQVATAQVATNPPPPPPPPVTKPTVGSGPGGHPMPSCPHGSYCVPPPTASDKFAPAPAPYEKCSTTSAEYRDGGAVMVRDSRQIIFSASKTAEARKKDPNTCCYDWFVPCPGGRAFRDATGTPAVARVVLRTDWVAPRELLADVVADVPNRTELAAHWAREAAFEHASVASFAQLTLDLLAVGAPPDLLEASQRACLDEIAHARITYALASSYGGAPVGPAPLEARPGACRSLADLARTTFVDACVGESVAAAELSERARRESDPALRAALETMAADEERHADLAWRIVAWALRSGDPAVAAALADARDTVIDELVELGRSASGGGLRATVLREVVVPCAVALLTSPVPADPADRASPRPVAAPPAGEPLTQRGEGW